MQFETRLQRGLVDGTITACFRRWRRCQVVAGHRYRSPIGLVLVDSADELLETLGDIGVKGPALVVRSGGGRAGETFEPQEDRTTIGRSPDCGIFLDDVTVSRRHAVLVERGDGIYIEDQGSLNGTFVNRKRVESAQLEDGDELQVGKYRLTYFAP